MKCPYCKSENSMLYYQARMPNILSACPESMLNKIKIYPLEVRLCNNCLLGFNSTKLNENELKEIYDNYLYISPTLNIGSTKYIGMVETLKKYFSKEDKIIEIGCSEGYILNQLKRTGYLHLTGFEPGPQAEKAKQSGLNIVKGYFDENTLKDELIDGFYLMHVFEHFEDPFIILDVMKKHLSKNGKIIIEVPDFSGYHHQHLYFYNLPFLKKLCDDKNLKIVEHVIDMAALRVTLTHKDNGNYKEDSFDVTSRDIVERAEGIHNEFTRNITDITNFLSKFNGKKVYWWGAGSASVICLNQLDLSFMENIELIILDGDKNKWGFFIPGINLKVNPYEIINGESIDAMVIASSFHNEIMDTLRKNNIVPKEIKIFKGV